MIRICLPDRDGSVVEIELAPLTACGRRRYAASGRLVAAEGCAPDPPHVETGGRTGLVLEPPPGGFAAWRLSKRERAEYEEQIRAAGGDPEAYVALDTVHGRWKRGCNQGLVYARAVSDRPRRA
jgi:hypothetical protein